ncbi:unnamed protein product [Cladocopium goreaui]|uniref:CCHC-type domain-containing protein n=1 Tax=Cladocopium goreaui TaxID=2562237 RepID=A0A9P1GH16_9DINO|nr:unnamed protein product [Cladocopium goreaui]
MNSTCRICNKKGHWKAECPFRQSSTTASASGMSHSSASGTLPTTTVIADQGDDMLPLEFVQLPELTMPKSDESQPSFLSKNDHLRPTAMTAMDRIQRNARPRSEVSLEAPRQASASPNLSESQVCFATHASYGILDLGASKTVIGSECLPELIRSLDADTQKQLTRCPCHVTFRFGNEATLSSKQALVIPLGKLLLKVAIVPGGTPFLLSNTLMRVMEASIDCAKHTLSSKMFNTPVKLQLTPKGLFLIDINSLIQAAKDNKSASRTTGAQTFAETFVSDEVSEKGQPKPITITAKSDHTCSENMSLSQCLRNLQIPTNTTELASLEHLTLEDLNQEVVTFGQKYMGCHFQDTWQDQEWVQFMVSRYQRSTKEGHRRYLRYVELKVETMEQQQSAIPPRSNPPTTVRGQAKAKAKASPVAPHHTSLPDGEADWDIEPETYASLTMTGPNIYTQEDMRAIQDRMLHMENALSRVIRHIEDQALMQQMIHAEEEQ